MLLKVEIFSNHFQRFIEQEGREKILIIEKKAGKRDFNPCEKHVIIFPRIKFTFFFLCDLPAFLRCSSLFNERNKCWRSISKSKYSNKFVQRGTFDRDFASCLVFRQKRVRKPLTHMNRIPFINGPSRLNKRLAIVRI